MSSVATLDRVVRTTVISGVVCVVVFTVVSDVVVSPSVIFIGTVVVASASIAETWTICGVVVSSVVTLDCVVVFTIVFGEVVSSGAMLDCVVVFTVVCSVVPTVVTGVVVSTAKGILVDTFSLTIEVLNTGGVIRVSLGRTGVVVTFLTSESASVPEKLFSIGTRVD